VNEVQDDVEDKEFGIVTPTLAHILVVQISKQHVEEVVACLNIGPHLQRCIYTVGGSGIHSLKETDHYDDAREAAVVELLLLDSVCLQSASLCLYLVWVH